MKFAIYPVQPTCPVCFEPLPRPEWFNEWVKDGPEERWREHVECFCKTCYEPRQARLYAIV